MRAARGAGDFGTRSAKKWYATLAFSFTNGRGAGPRPEPVGVGTARPSGARAPRSGPPAAPPPSCPGEAPFLAARCATRRVGRGGRGCPTKGTPVGRHVVLGRPAARSDSAPKRSPASAVRAAESARPRHAWPIMRLAPPTRSQLATRGDASPARGRGATGTSPSARPLASPGDRVRALGVAAREVEAAVEERKVGRDDDALVPSRAAPRAVSHPAQPRPVDARVLAAAVPRIAAPPGRPGTTRMELGLVGEADRGRDRDTGRSSVLGVGGAQAAARGRLASSRSLARSAAASV